MATANGHTRRWWKEAVVYQIYPRSFKDSNGDGIGDLRGITSQLDYIQGLGVDAIWLSPHLDSPNADNGYDIRDYRQVMAEFGTMADFDGLLRGIKQRGLRLILDLVLNHTSDEHPWFVESRTSRDNRYRDYYLWRPPKEGHEPNNWVSLFSGPAWTKDSTTGEFYLHLFATKQPDLNWDNPTVRQEVYSLMKFWLDKGVDGFRVDAVPFISKRAGLPNYPPPFEGRPEFFYADGPLVHDYLQEMNRVVLSQYDVMTVGEAFGVPLEQIPRFVDERRHELNMVFQFDAVSLAKDDWRWRPWALPDLKAIYRRASEALDGHAWHAVALSSHDEPRVVSAFGDDAPPLRVPSAKVLATLLLTQKGTPFVYQGDELAMTNYPFTAIEQFDDVAAKNGWKALVESGKVPAAEYLAALGKNSRDHARTPMQWDDSLNGGFTTASRPWLAVNPNYAEINAKRSLGDGQSVYHYFSTLIALRKRTPALIYGDYNDLDPTHPSVFAYTRMLANERYLVLLNFSKQEVRYTLPGGRRTGRLLLSNLGGAPEQVSDVTLKPWEARIYAF